MCLFCTQFAQRLKIRGGVLFSNCSFCGRCGALMCELSRSLCAGGSCIIMKCCTAEQSANTFKINVAPFVFPLVGRYIACVILAAFNPIEKTMKNYKKKTRRSWTLPVKTRQLAPESWSILLHTVYPCSAGFNILDEINFIVESTGYFNF